MINSFYIQKKSIIHDLDFWTKFLSMLLIFPLTAIIAPAKMLPFIVILLIIFQQISGVSFKKFWSMTKSYNIPTTIGVVILSLLLSEGTMIERLENGLIFAVRFIVLISFGVLFSMTTNPIEIPSGMMKVKIPHKYGVTIMVGYRMMPLISSKIKRVMDAQMARGANIKFSIKNFRKFLTNVLSLMIPILHSTLETSVKLSETLISRGYNPDGKITVPPSKFNKWDFLFIFSSLIILIITFVKY